MAIDPVIGGIATGLLGYGQGIAESNARRQAHADSVAFQEVETEYAGWIAEVQRDEQDLNNQYTFFQERVNWGQDNIYVAGLRNYELSKAINQSKVVADTRISAAADYINQSDAINAAAAEQAMADAMSSYHYKLQGLRMAASAEAGGVGMIDRIQQDFSRQVGDMNTMQAISQQFKDRQLTRQQAGAIATYLARYNSQQFYEVQEYQDPLMPFAPLPTLVSPIPPSMTGAAPSASMGAFSAIAGGVGQGLNTYTGLEALA